MTDRYEEIREALAHEIWAAAQLAPGEGIVDGVDRIAALLRKEAHTAITHCDNCGCDWLDNGLNPVGCPYCKQHATAAQVAEIEALREEVAEWKRVAAAQAELHGEAEDRADKLAEALREVMLWIENWSPPFTEDDEWPDTEAKAQAALRERLAKGT